MLKKTLISSIATAAILASGAIAAAQEGQKPTTRGLERAQERAADPAQQRGLERAQERAAPAAGGLQTQTQQPTTRGLDRAQERASDKAQQRGLERAQERAAPAAGGEGQTGQRTGDQQRDRTDQRQQTGDQQRDRTDQRQQTGDQQRDRTDQRQQTGQDQRGERTTTGQVPRVEINPQQRTELRRQFREVNIRTVPRNRINVNLVIGAVLPQTIEFYPLPGPILSIVPQFRGYHAIQVGDQILIVEPVTRRVVYIIEV
jgi:hypothetical protein